ncbi:MAG: hypothetical protein HYU30_07050 [Chloroflexi bacterium]|nr:hypothetical protein [Chloroflexota bacterium]MBI4198428.1 hypothetical protein [Chloroflexota bacterium]
MRMKSRDLYRLRRMQLYAQRCWLQAQMAQQRLQECTLELERRYDLLAREATLNVHTGEITLSTMGEAAGVAPGKGPLDSKEVSNGPAHDAVQRAP